MAYLESLLEFTELAPSASSSGPVSAKRTRNDVYSEDEGTEQQKRARGEVYTRPGLPSPTDVNSFRVPDRPSPPLRPDDKDGHYVFELGENLTTRYKILSKMGEGTFGRVLECWDRKYKDYVAIKIVRNIDKYRHAAMIELEVLNTLAYNDGDGQHHCIALREWFDYRGHVCMVFEKLGPSLFDFLRKNEYRPFPLDLVQNFSRQLLESVAYMHELELVHTDLKPENILLVSLEHCKATSPAQGRRPAVSRVVPTSSHIKLIDFGSATFEDGHHSSIVSTRHYRAPEVILGLGWSYPCDMWSVGCIIVELLTGDALFQTHDNLEHLAMMEQVLGTIPGSMAARTQGAAAKFFNGTRLHWPEGAGSKKSIKAVTKMVNLRRHILEHGDSSAVPHIELLVDLLQAMLRYEPTDRISAQEALMHPFFQVQLQTSIPITSSDSSQELAAQQPGSYNYINMPQQTQMFSTAQQQQMQVLGMQGMSQDMSNSLGNGRSVYSNGAGNLGGYTTMNMNMGTSGLQQQPLMTTLMTSSSDISRVGSEQQQQFFPFLMSDSQTAAFLQSAGLNMMVTPSNTTGSTSNTHYGW